MAINSLKTHKSVRKYTDEPVSDAQLKNIVEAGIRGSNTGNMQLYSIIATTDAATKALLAPAHFNQPMVTEAPLVITVCADINRMNKWCAERNADAGFDNMQTFISATVDAIIAAENIALAAEEEGLGICFLGTTTYNPDTIIDALELPRGVMPITTITIGHPATELSLTERLPMEAVLHIGKYKDYTSADIDKLYAEKEANPENQKFVEENKKETLAQVFSEIRYGREGNEAFSVTFMEALRRQGFMK